MNSQEDWSRQWDEAFLDISGMSGIGHEWINIPINSTMIYTDQQAKALADAAVGKAEETAKVEEKEPLSEEEKDRLWKAVLESCSG